MEEFLCSICKVIPKFPIILPCCMRTICKDHKSTNCQFCNGDLQNNPIFPNTILSYYYNSSIPQKCERCGENNNTIFCHNCKASLCKDCSNLFHSQGVFTKHTLSNCLQLINNIDSLDICSHHKLPLKYYCVKDSLAICRRCKDNHNNHSLQSIENTAGDRVSEINLKQEGISKYLKFTQKDMAKCNNAIESLAEGYKNSKDIIIIKFKALKQALQWKEEEILGEIETIFNRKKLEIGFFLESLAKTEKKLQQVIEFLDVTKKLPPNTILTYIKYINHIINLGLEIENLPLSFGKTEFPSKLDITPCQNLIDSLSLHDESFTVNSSLSNTNTAQSNRSSTAKSPQRLRKVLEKKPTPIKSRTNSRESNLNTPVPDENPLDARVFSRKLQNSTAIQVSWNHPSKQVQGLVYCLEYGVGTKMNNVEQFRQVYRGTAHTCIITDLLPKTSYRFRVAPLIGEEKGDWSEVATITTLDSQKIDPTSFGAHACFTTRAQEKFIQFDKAGIIFGCNALSFGKHAWDVKIINNNLYASEGNLLKIGVSSSKSKVVHGLDIDYQACKGNIKIKVVIDIESGNMIVICNASPQAENLFGLPEGNIVPAIQYKPSKTSTAPVRLSVDFEC